MFMRFLSDELTFVGKLKDRCFGWFLAAILVSLKGTPRWPLHTFLTKNV